MGVLSVWYGSRETRALRRAGRGEGHNSMIEGQSASTVLAFSCIMVPYGCGYSTALQHYSRLQSKEEREENKIKNHVMP